MVRHAVVALGLVAACGDDHQPCAEAVPGSLCEVAGTGALGWNGDGRRASETDLYAPSQARRGPDGRVWLMDWNNHRLRVIDDDGVVRTVAGSGWHAYASLDVAALESPLENPIDFDFVAGGEVVFIQSHDPRVIRLDAGGVLRLVAGSGELGDGGDGGAAADASFTGLAGIAVDPRDGAIYVADADAGRVRVVRGGQVFGFAGTPGARGYAGDGGPASAALLADPTGLAIGPDGAVFIADRKNHAVRRVGPDGVITTVAGTGGAPGFSGDGGPATAATLDDPAGVALGADGTLYIADRDNLRVRAVAPDGVITTVAGTGESGGRGAGGDALAAQLGVTSRLSIADGELFIADQGNSCARVLLLD